MPASVKQVEKISDIKTPEQLMEAGFILPEAFGAIKKVYQHYAIGIPPTLRELIKNADDPIGRQLIPHPDELDHAPHEHEDPIGDERFSPVPGIVHRYKDRVLLKPVLICPLYCRFCFRRSHVGPEGGLLPEHDLLQALEWIKSRTDISEVILTGGDPLMLSPRRLGEIFTRLNQFSHITTLRIHTRLPIASPERITPELLSALETPKALWMALHINHSHELGQAARLAIQKLVKAGIPLLGQSVLLKGVNNTVEALEQLFRTLVENRIKPYYLHQLDAAPGTSRFHVSIEEGIALLENLRGRLTGLAWPTYVLDIAQGYGKVPLGPHYLHPKTDNEDKYTKVADPQGRFHFLQRGSDT